MEMNYKSEVVRLYRVWKDLMDLPFHIIVALPNMYLKGLSFYVRFLLNLEIVSFISLYPE